MHLSNQQNSLVMRPLSGCTQVKWGNSRGQIMRIMLTVSFVCGGIWWAEIADPMFERKMRHFKGPCISDERYEFSVLLFSKVRKDQDWKTVGWCHWVSGWYRVEDSFITILPHSGRSLNSLTLSAGISCRHWDLTVGYYPRLEWAEGARSNQQLAPSAGSPLRLPPPGAKTQELRDSVSWCPSSAILTILTMTSQVSSSSTID